MKIAIATPLFPPDIGGASHYVKELAERLAQEHTVTIIAYGRLPEPTENVSIVNVPKNAPLPVRIFRYARALYGALAHTDVLYVENGASVELPVLVATLLRPTTYVLHIGDPDAQKHGLQNVLRQMLHALVSRRANKVVTELPTPRPEILPFESYPENAFRSYEDSWSSHVANLSRLFAHD